MGLYEPLAGAFQFGGVTLQKVHFYTQWPDSFLIPFVSFLIGITYLFLLVVVHVVGFLAKFAPKRKLICYNVR